MIPFIKPSCVRIKVLYDFIHLLQILLLLIANKFLVGLFAYRLCSVVTIIQGKDLLSYTLDTKWELREKYLKVL